MDIVKDIAIIVGLARDVVLLVLLLVLLVAALAVAAKLREILNNVRETSDTVRETVNTVSEKVVEPAASNAGAMRGLGGFLGLLLGMRRKKRGSDD